MDTSWDDSPESIWDDSAANVWNETTIGSKDNENDDTENNSWNDSETKASNESHDKTDEADFKSSASNPRDPSCNLGLPDLITVRIGDRTSSEVVGTILRSTWNKFSTYRTPIRDTIYLNHNTSMTAATIVLEWLNSQPEGPSQPLPLPHSVATFDEICQIHNVCFQLYIKKHLRGDEVRQEIVEYIDDAPLTMPEFAMVLELCKIDTPLVEHMVTMTRKLGEEGVPDWNEIVDYAEGMGRTLMPDGLKLC